MPNLLKPAEKEEKKWAEKCYSEDDLRKICCKLENHAKWWLILPKGYCQSETRDNTGVHLNVTVTLITTIYTIRCIILIFVNDVDEWRFWLGSMFIPGDKIGFYMNLCAAELTFYYTVIKIYLVFREQLCVISSYQLFYEICTCQVAKVFHELKPQSADNLSKFIYKNFRTYFTRVTTQVIILCILLCYLTLTNPEVYESKGTALLKFLWTLIGLIFFNYNLRATFWHTTHIYALFKWMEFRADSARLQGQEIIQSKKIYRKNVVSFVAKLNKIFTEISIINQEFWGMILLWYAFGSLTADTALFVGIFANLKSTTIEISLIFLALNAITSIATLNLLSAQCIKKINRCHVTVFQVMSHRCLHIRDSLKLLSVLERMSVKQVGFYVGGIIMDDYSLLRFLLENMSILILFITNLQRK